MKNNDYPIEKKLRCKLYVILVLYVVIGFALTVLLGYIFTLLENPVITWLYWRMDALFIFYIIIGFFAIFYYYWKKPWAYLNEIVEATQTIYEQNDHTIALSEPLQDIANQMNQIKMSVLLSKQAVKEAEDKKNELVMYLAHDIRTPLTSIIGYLNLLEEEPNMPVEPRKKRVHIALEKAYRLETMINEFFEITKYKSQKIKLSKETIDLYYMLIQLSDELFPVLDARGNTVSLQLDENLTVNADPEKLARVFNNILKNAALYSDPNSEILISAEKTEQEVIIKFQNRGENMPDEAIQYLFDKFYRADKSRSSDTGGTGLGLAIAKEIIILHGGQIRVSSKNHVVTFSVSLPLAN